MSSLDRFGSQHRRRSLPSRLSSAAIFFLSMRRSPPGVVRRNRLRCGLAEMTPSSFARSMPVSVSEPAIACSSWAVIRSRVAASPDGLLGVVAEHEPVVGGCSLFDLEVVAAWLLAVADAYCRGRSEAAPAAAPVN
ncbi:hypothetical protein [Dactylosporangium sp. NPDC048998]|uniref:hypothetical protein n=1 Tax=Dactylosporangium sp. NPDC048998 TaxID=3363976 RepID=UPI003716FB74